MKRTFCLIIFFITTSLSVVYSQLQLRVLDSDPKRGIAEELKVSSKTSRIESDNIVDTVNFGITIQIISGNNPRCSDDTSPVTFKAFAVNGGSNPKFEWYKDGNLIIGASDTLLTLYGIIANNKISCALTSKSKCVTDTSKPLPSAESIITVSGILTPSVNISVLSGSNPGCASDTIISFLATPTNGGSSPTYQWFYYDGTTTGIVGGNLPTYSRSNMPTGRYVYCVMTSDLSCAIAPKIDTSNRITRLISQYITPAVDMSLLNITNPDCMQKKFNFRALPINPGSIPRYSWFVNNIQAGTTSGTDFSTSLINNGDNIYVQMTSSLACANPQNVASGFFLKADTLQTLPFFDDFSASKFTPNKLLWVRNGGTYINNNLCVEPPTYNVASFDGLQYNGRSYDSLNIYAKGITDNLTSLPIDISKSITTKLHLVFYWQPQGLGETPDSSQGDYLTLYFKNSTGDWVEIWSARGTSVQPFKQEVIPIISDTSNNYRHAGFQFKFQTTGRLSGMYDVWNVDYIYLNIADTSFVSFNDQAFSVTPKPVLKRYSSMPLEHYRSSAQTEFKTEDTTYINNLYNKLNSLGIRADFYNNHTGTFLTNITSSGSNFTNPNERNLLVKVPILSNPVPDTAKAPFELRTTFSLSGDSNNIDGKKIDYRVNNTISGVTIFDNFYAYDDGSAEYGIGINQKFGQVAYRYFTTKRDTLKQIAINIIKMGVIASGQSINVCVWKSLPTNPTSTDKTVLLFKKNYALTFPVNIDGYVVFKLDSVVIVADSFYVGYQQISDDALTIGWDKNINSNENIFYSTTSKWENYSDEKGSMMIRPVFGEYHYATEIKSEIKSERQITLYPNPSSGHVCTDVQLEAAEILNLNGEIVWSSDNINDNCFNLGDTPDGFYVVRLKAERKYFYKKLIIRK